MVTASRRARLLVAAIAVAVAGWAGAAAAGEGQPVIDLDAWHLELGGADGVEPDREADRGFVLGVNPKTMPAMTAQRALPRERR